MPGLTAQDVLSPLHDLAEDRWTATESLWHGVLDNIIPLTSTALEEPRGDGLRECGVDKIITVAVLVPEVEEASREKHTSKDETDTTPVSSGVPIVAATETRDALVVRQEWRPCLRDTLGLPLAEWQQNGHHVWDMEVPP